LTRRPPLMHAKVVTALAVIVAIVFNVGDILITPGT
jgi:hypothetical protein